MRALKNSLMITALLAVVVVGGWGVWYTQQDPAMRAAIRETSFKELVFTAWQMYGPSAHVDYASYERRSYPGRGHSPWVLRSSLDGISRMISFALDEDHWLSYNTERGFLYQFWQGGIEFEGVVYTTVHGPDPVSTGTAYLHSEYPDPWLLQVNGAWEVAQVNYLGHFYSSDHSQAAIRLSLAVGETRVQLVEWPEILRQGDTVGLQRRFVIESATPGTRVALELGLPPKSVSVRSDGEFVDGQGWVGQARLHLNEDVTELELWFEKATLPIRPRDSGVQQPLSEGQLLLANDDCGSCHNEQERIAGPSWLEIAERYADAPRDVLEPVVDKIIEGGAGAWGTIPMVPHPQLSRVDAQRMLAWILQRKDARDDSFLDARESIREHYSWTYDYDNAPRLEGLHPALTVESLLVEGFTPRVGGVDVLPDGRIVIVTWDSDGAAYIVDPDGGQPVVKRIAEGLHEPLGVAVVDGRIFVMQKQELTELVDRDGDEVADEYRTVSNHWGATSNFHEFGFGLLYRDDHFYAALSVCVRPGGNSCAKQLPDRGTVMRIHGETGEVDFVATGLRTPNGLGFGPEGHLFVTDNQGDWLPSSKLLEIKEGNFFGWRSEGTLPSQVPEIQPPTLWLPQNEIGNSPTEPVLLSHGPYQGQMLFGDIYNGGIKRAFLEKVDGRYQGAAFHFTEGLAAAVNRLKVTDSGDILVGEIGNPGNWQEPGKPWYGLERLRFGDGIAFEMLEVRARRDGFEIVLTEPVSQDIRISPADLRVQQWFYHPSRDYGGPKFDVTTLSVRQLQLSRDRRRIYAHIDGLKQDHVVYLRLNKRLRSAGARPLWTSEAWYTLNALPDEALPPATQTEVTMADVTEQAGPNRLTQAELDAGWRLLFDGYSTEGWRNYRAPDGAPVQGWVVEEGALKMTQDTSMLGFILRVINPFSRSVVDLMYEQPFRNFELSVDWKISPDGNSGIFYLIPDEDQRMIWNDAFEMQVLDNDGHPDGKIHKHRAGDLYDIKAASKDMAKPVGEWNTARIRVQDDHIQHWLNGEKIVDIRRSGEEWQRLLGDSKFSGNENYGQAKQGYIALQDHGDVVWFRNIKVRPLP